MSAQDRLVADRFRLIRRLGSGAMASVFLAEDCELGRHVAIKRLHPETPAEIAPRFRREMRVAASLSHPNIVTLYDAIADGDSVLLVMEYVDGPTLAQHMAHGPLDPEEALGILRQLAEAIDHLHGQGVIHRDVKPANVLLDGGGRVKLTDLGIASAAEATGITTSGSVLGTPAYMAPELFEGERATPAADVYSLAAIAYEMLSGRRARQGGTPAAIALRSGDPPPDLRELQPEASALAAALARGMANDPAQRPSSASAFADEVADALEQDARGAEPTRPLAPIAADEADADAEPEPELAPAPQDTAEVRPATSGSGPAVVPEPVPPRPEPRRPDEPPPERRRRAPAILLAAAGALVAGVVLAVVLAGGGSGDPGSGAASTPRTASTARGDTATTARRTGSTPAATASAPRTTSTPAGTTSAPSTTSTPAGTTSAPRTTSTTAPPPSAGAASPDSPEGAVQAFYGRAAAHRYDDAWALAAPGLRSQLGGFAEFRSQFSSVRSIEFSRAETLRRDANGARVAIATTATHTNRVDHCTGTADTAPADGGGWIVTHLNISC